MRTETKFKTITSEDVTYAKVSEEGAEAVFHTRGRHPIKYIDLYHKTRSLGVKYNIDFEKWALDLCGGKCKLIVADDEQYIHPFSVTSSDKGFCLVPGGCLIRVRDIRNFIENNPYLSFEGVVMWDWSTSIYLVPALSSYI